jgi:multimeric flavodoxin WrbA
MKITAIYGSPRKKGNTDLLLDAFLKEFENPDHVINRFFLRKMSISPCIECEKCYTTGRCVLDDDMNALYPLFKNSDIVVLSSPVFFYGLNALAKAMVDRSQCCWSQKYLLNQKQSDSGTKPKGVFLTVGGAKGKRNFEGIMLTVRYFFDALDIEFTNQLLVKEIDQKGAIMNHPTALEDARNLAKELLRS